MTLYLCFKTIFDRLFAFALIILLSPLLLFLCLLVKLKLGSPVLFRQQRSGFNTKPFYIYKFRTMSNSVDRNGELLPDYKRLTPFGCFLRKTSLDELPSLFNIIQGQLSFVGPRPLPVSYLPLYSSYQLRRHSVMPGLTGLAQSKGRNLLSWRSRFRYDVFYTSSFCFSLDLYILWLTIYSVLFQYGITPSDRATMTPFTGDSKK